MAAEKSGRPLFLGSYPITPATDILHELAKRKDLGVKAVQMEDEIAGVCSAIGASFAGNLGVTSTSGPGLALKSEGIGLAVMAELPLVVIDVQRGGPSTGLPTKTEQTDLMQALYGRNGESPLVVVAPASPTDCFTMAFEASRIAIEHMTPVILLSDAFIGNGSSAWRIPDDDEYPAIKPHYVPEEMRSTWRAYQRDEESNVRYWAIPGTEGLTHRLGGLEKDFVTGAISTDPANHEKMVNIRREKIARIADDIPALKIQGDADADTDFGGDTDISDGSTLDAGGAMQLFTMRNIINFLLGLGWGGVCLYSVIPNAVVLSIVAILVGVAFVYVFILIYRQMRRFEKNGAFDIKESVGHTVDVYLAIPAKRSGSGKVQVSFYGSVQELAALTDSDSPIRSGAKVRILEIVDGGTVLVEKV